VRSRRAVTMMVSIIIGRGLGSQEIVGEEALANMAAKEPKGAGGGIRRMGCLRAGPA